MATQHPLEDTFRKAIDEINGDKVTVDDVLELFGHRSFGPIFAILGLVTLIPPIGSVPGLPTIVGVVLILFSVQMLLGRSHIWLPGFIADRAIDKEKLRQAHDKSEGLLKMIDRPVTERLTWATRGAAKYVAALLVSFLALLMIPLELLPFAVAIPGLAVVMIGIALIAHDGALMLAACVFAGIALAVALFWSPIF